MDSSRQNVHTTVTLIVSNKDLDEFPKLFDRKQNTEAT